jgi:long-chain acyl-CoA synthetase
MENSIIEMFRARAKANPEHAIFQHKIRDQGWVGISYRELAERVDHFALGLAELGLNRGDPVAIISENCPEWAVADLGTIALGGVVVPLYATLTPVQIEYILENAGVTCVVVQNLAILQKIQKIRAKLPRLQCLVIFEAGTGDLPEGVETLASLEVRGQKLQSRDPAKAADILNIELQPDDMVTIVYTSGTTKAPKGVMLSHRNLLNNSRLIDLFQVNEHDRSLNFLPFAHILGRAVEYYGIIHAGATLCFSEHYLALPRNLQEVKPNAFVTVPALLERAYGKIMDDVNSGSRLRRLVFHFFLKQGRKHSLRPSFVTSLLSHFAARVVFRPIKARFGGEVRFMVVGGGATSREVQEFFWAVGLPLYEGYGLTESAPVISFNAPGACKIGSVGRPTAGMEVQIAADGEILAKGENIMLGYWKNPEETQQTIDAEGYLHTGDVGQIDNDGFLRITDRKKEIFVLSSGKNVPPQPIEKAMLQSPFIAQAVTIGNEREHLVALIVPNFEAVERDAKKRGITWNSREELLQDSTVRNLFKKEIKKQLVDFAAFEQVKKFHLLPQELSQANDELTPTLKLKRRVIAKRYEREIANLYAEE